MNYSLESILEATVVTSETAVAMPKAGKKRNVALEAAIEATPAGDRPTYNVVAEVHDVNQIKVEEDLINASLARFSNVSVWDAAEYGITREEAERRIREASTPEAKARVIEELTLLAINRAGLDTSNGRVNVMIAGGKDAWHQLGVRVDRAVGSKDAIVLAGLNWVVTKEPVRYVIDGVTYEMDDRFVLVRQDTKAALGVVGSVYKPIQNEDAFDFLDGVLEQYGAQYETAGSLHGGKKVWMTAYLPDQSFRAAAGDDVDTYAVFMMPHDGSGAAYCYPTTNRPVCANTLRVSLRDKKKGIMLRHTGSIKARVREAQYALNLSVSGFERMAEEVQAMTRTGINEREYFNAVLDAVLEVTAADMAKGPMALIDAALAKTMAQEELEAKVKEIERKMEKRSSLLEEIFERYESERCGIAGIRGTAWGALNAVTEQADHARPRRMIGTAEERLSRRFESNLTGDSDDMKQVAYELALASTTTA